MPQPVETYGPRDVKRIFGVKSDTTLAEWVKRRIIPPPRYFNARVRRWTRDEIDEIAAGKRGK